MDFDKILNWKLLAGSNKFPGPEGGTCINEAAVVAAGFEYKEIRSLSDVPFCFSRPIAHLALVLNDNMMHDHRQALMKYVCKLAGSADTPDIEYYRNMLGEQIITNGIMKLAAKYRALAEASLDEGLAISCESVMQVVKKPSSRPDWYISILQYFFVKLYITAIGQLGMEALCTDLADELGQLGMEALDKMLAIGNQADPIEIGIITERMETVKKVVKARETVS